MSLSNRTNLQLKRYSSGSIAHSHDFYQWVLPLQGELELKIGKETGYVSGNRAAFIRPDEIHHFASHNKNEFLVLDAGNDYCWMNNVETPSFWKLTSTLQNYLKFAKTYLTQQINQELNKALVQDFLLKLLAQHFLSSFDKRIQTAKHWIDIHFAESMDIKKVAQVSCLSNSQLQRRFMRALGLSVGAYWRSVRLQQAELMLKANFGSIEQIALCVGYQSLASFSRSFSHAYGMSPSQYQHASNCKKVTPIS